MLLRDRKGSAAGVLAADFGVAELAAGAHEVAAVGDAAFGEDAFGLVHDAYEIGMINCKLFSQSMRNQSEGLLGAH